MNSDTGNTTSLVLGFPIRTSSDPRSVGSSPRHIAASHVLHRPLMPRHPPCALKHLQHKNQSFQIEITPQQPTDTSRPPPPHPPKREEPEGLSLPRVDARNHYPRIKHHTPPPKPGATTHLPPHTGAREHRPVVSKPNSVLGDPPNPTPRGRRRRFLSSSICTRTRSTTETPRTGATGPSNESPDNRLIPHDVGPARSRGAP